MNDLTKKEAMVKWLEMNPGKTKQDWLLEERCMCPEQRRLLTEILSKCIEDEIKIPACIDMNEQGCVQFVERGYDLYLLQPLRGIPKTERGLRMVKILPTSYFKGRCPTKIQFDFSLFNKFYFDLDQSNDYAESQGSPVEQWRECILRKLRNLIKSDKESENYESEIKDIASLFIHSNEKLMHKVPLYDFSSQEFLSAYKEELKRKEYIKAHSLDKTPPARLWPTGAKVPYTLSHSIHQLTLLEFLNKINQPDICKGGRFVISLINVKDKTLVFPDEAAGIVNRFGEVYSGYYEEFGVTYPENMDLTKIINTFPLAQPLVARTKRSGTLPILDVVPFEYNGYAFNAIVVDRVVDNGICSTVKDWL